MGVLHVDAKSNPSEVAGVIADAIREYGRAVMQAIGAGALNQAVKALAIARGFMAPIGVDLVCRSAFAHLRVHGQDRTATRLIIEPA